MSRYLDRILARFKRQKAKGIAKYGQPLEDNPRGVIEALEYLAEELTDGLMYVEEAIEKLKKERQETDCYYCKFYDITAYWCNKFDKGMLMNECCIYGEAKEE